RFYSALVFGYHSDSIQAVHRGGKRTAKGDNARWSKSESSSLLPWRRLLADRQLPASCRRTRAILATGAQGRECRQDSEYYQDSAYKIVDGACVTTIPKNQRS